MIGFNGTYLGIASHGNMRITAASIGGQWVLGNWLFTATAQAIIAAFGAEEGIAVITKTNDYLNAIALTDTTRAQQLANFINQYPLYAAMLGSIYQKVDYIESNHVKDGISYLVIDYYLNNKSAIDAVFSGNVMSSNKDMLFGANNTSGNCESYSTSGNIWLIREGGGQAKWSTSDVVGHKKVRLTQSKDNPAEITFKNLDEGVESTQVISRGEIAATTKLHLFTIARATGTKWNEGMRIYQFDIYEDSDLVVGLAPCYAVSDGTIGMYDYINNKFYDNQGSGSFTIALTDKTPA